jgi:dolichol-phosphate mannosyltransferase
MKPFIIIPTFNEKHNIDSLIKAIFGLVSNASILIVDDNSPDGTAEIVRQLQTQQANLFLLSRPGKLGLGSAYVAGFKYALAHDASLIFEMDADGSHDPKHIPEMIKVAAEFDVVIGSRRIKGGKIVGWNAWRHFASWAAMTTARLILNLKTNDVTAGFRCYRKEVLTTLNLDQIKSNGYAFQEEMIWWCEKNDLNIKEIPITFLDRQKDKSKLSWRDIMEFFKTIIRLRFS